MRVNKCDVCNRTYEPYEGVETYTGDANGLLLVSFNTRGRYEKRGYFDLCPECANKLVNFLNIQPTLIDDLKDTNEEVVTYEQEEQTV